MRLLNKRSKPRDRGFTLKFHAYTHTHVCIHIYIRIHITYLQYSEQQLWGLSWTWFCNPSAYFAATSLSTHMCMYVCAINSIGVCVCVPLLHASITEANRCNHSWGFKQIVGGVYWTHLCRRRKLQPSGHTYIYTFPTLTKRSWRMFPMPLPCLCCMISVDVDGLWLCFSIIHVCIRPLA